MAEGNLDAITIEVEKELIAGKTTVTQTGLPTVPRSSEGIYICAVDRAYRLAVQRVFTLMETINCSEPEEAVALKKGVKNYLYGNK